MHPRACLLAICVVAAPLAAMAQSADPETANVDPAGNATTSGEATGDRAAEEVDPDPGFWAQLAGTMPLGASARLPHEGGFWARTAEGIGRIWSGGRPTLLVSGYAWHLPWKHKTERQKQFNSAALGAGFARSLAEDDRRQRILYVLANQDSYDKVEYMTGYVWQARWHPYGTLRLGAGYNLLLIGRHEYNYVPLPLVLPAFSVGTDSAEMFASYVPYGEVLLLIGRFTF